MKKLIFILVISTLGCRTDLDWYKRFQRNPDLPRQYRVMFDQTLGAHISQGLTKEEALECTVQDIYLAILKQRPLK